MHFYPITTEDQTISLFNFEVNDVYHSKVGAYTEALNKYVIPSGLKDFVKCNDSVNILDVCFGLGYNSKTAVNEILKINPKIDINITALEIDPVVLAFSCIIGNECFDEVVNEEFFDAINNQINVEQIIKDHLKNVLQILPQIKEKIPKEYDLITPGEIEAKLHNIYYRSISTRKSIDNKACDNGVKAEFLIKDARKSIKSLNSCYDFIFHDPFTPAKVPVLWTVEFFSELFRLLDFNGNITTYSNAAPIRAGLIEAGFNIGATKPVGKKSTGTIAYKNSTLLKHFLSEKESELLKTNAGIPYRDKNLNNSVEKILINREKEQISSDRISSSKFLKSYKK